MLRLGKAVLLGDFNTVSYTNRKNTRRPIVKTKQTEKKYKTGKTSTNNSPRKTKCPGNVLPWRGAQNMFYIRDAKIVSSYVRGFPKVHFHVKFKGKQLKRNKISYKGSKKKKK